MRRSSPARSISHCHVFRVLRQVIEKEQRYIKDLNFIEEVCRAARNVRIPSSETLTRSCKAFIRPLRNADPPVIQGSVDGFIDEVFGNILDLRECNRHLLEAMYIRQQEQGGIISRIGDIFLNAVTEFRLAYPTYIGQLAAAERRLEEMERNGKFKAFLEVCARFS